MCVEIGTTDMLATRMLRVKKEANDNDVQGGNRLSTALILLIPLIAIAALPFVAIDADGEEDVQEVSTLQDAPTEEVTDEEVANVDAFFESAPTIAEDDPVFDSLTSQLTYVNLDSGQHIGSVSERFVSSSLSLSKLYIADYVFDHGTKRERAYAMMMISSSSDMLADRLYAKYPQSIKETAKKYSLQSTFDEDRWGYSHTSSFDVVSFISQLLTDYPDSQVLQAMRNSYPFGADRTRQNFGTYVLDGVEGSKWGWSDDRSLHSSVSFGHNEKGELFVAAAMVMGTPAQLTTYVENHLGETVGIDQEKLEEFQKAAIK